MQGNSNLEIRIYRKTNVFAIFFQDCLQLHCTTRPTSIVINFYFAKYYSCYKCTLECRSTICGFSLSDPVPIVQRKLSVEVVNADAETAETAKKKNSSWK